MRVKPSRLLLGFCCLVALLAVVAVGGVTADSGDLQADATLGEAPPVLTDSHVADCAEEPPEDLSEPEGGTSDTIGWVDGFWYNQPLEIEGDALTEEEVHDLSMRTAARVEALRCLTFESVPELEMVSRDDYEADVQAFYDEEYDQHDYAYANAQLSAMLLAGQDEDAVDVMIENQAAFPAAFYDVEEQMMGFVTDDPDSIQLDQDVLAHELLHALQDQYFDLEATFEEPTNDEFISSLAVIEGDANLVQEQYDSNCVVGHGWEDDCVRDDSEPPMPPNWGLTLNQLAAYNTPLVADSHEDGDWESVDSLLENLPNSTVEAIYPELYGEFERTPITVEDESAEDWERLDIDEPGYDILGQHALTSILMAPFYETQGFTEIISQEEFFQEHAGGMVSFGHSATDGWEADKMYGYTSDAGNGVVWKFAWESADDAETFTDAYADLIEYRGGQQSADYENVYTFDASDSYDKAIGIEQADDRLWIVTAPTVEGLTGVHADLELVEADDDPENGETDDTETDETDDVADDEATDDTEDDTDDDADDDGAGFSIVVGVLAILTASLLVFKRA